ncbi:hypothetical protein TetV_466 [Tetraselmis virus 1]|uniref:Uncharacterized protein n=1 Tax=Tetraselmis virus 1 TaxID=2060617 RepID=A0A2P0VNR1_9VIRU|nr:hypothetical protein QJ968_gp588 [Tetraselmis virus 1]AUF82548.1 hypothetical protein TetV_466 [Tetraselmis virus 1]
MKILHRKLGSTSVIDVNVIPDETVFSLASKLEKILRGRCYLWCEKQIDGYEAYAILRNSASSLDKVAVEARDRFGITLTNNQVKNDESLLKALKAIPNLKESVSMRNRYGMPGGYFANNNIDPYSNGSSPKEYKEFVTGSLSSPINTGNLLVEAFCTDKIYVTTFLDLQRAGDGSIKYENNVIKMYIPDNIDNNEYEWNSETLTRMEKQSKESLPKTTRSSYNFVVLSGGSVYGKMLPNADDMMRVFSVSETSENMPIIRIQGGGIDRPLSRVHDTAGAEDLMKLKDSSSREWIQAIFKINKGIAELTVFNGGSYKVKIRFSKLENAREKDITRYFQPINSFLEKLSVFIRPLEDKCLKASNSIFMKKSYMLNTPHVLGGPKSGIYQTITLPLPRKCSIRAIKKSIEEEGYPSLRVINIHKNDLHMIWMRSNVLSAQSVVKNVLYHIPRITEETLKQLQKETGLSKSDILDISERNFDKNTVMTMVSIKLLSDAELSITVKNGNDIDYGERIAACIYYSVKNCDRKSSSKASQFLVSSKVKANTEENINIGDLEEFYSFFEDNDDDDTVSDTEVGSTSSSIKIDPTKTDILGRLQRADPEVFAFENRQGFVPYSMKCQKSGKMTRQPLVLSEAEMETMLEGSSKEGKQVADTALHYRGNYYVCPKKWCPLSGIAKGLNESCPEDEPEWTLWNQHNPGLQPGVFHPSGLCMPCCFKPVMKPGGKTHADTMKCLGKQVEGNWKSDHVGKFDKLLDEGMYGYVPSTMFPKGTLKTTENPVRKGLGNKEKATFLNAYAESVNMTPEAVLNSIHKHVKLSNFVHCNIRDYIDVNCTDKKPLKTEIAEWLKKNPKYTKLMNIKKVGESQTKREHTIKLAYERFVKSLKTNPESITSSNIYNLINSGIGLTPVMLVSMDASGNCYVEHGSKYLLDSERCVVIMTKMGIYEPVGFKDKKNRFNTLWNSDHEWITFVKTKLKKIIPDFKIRIVSYSLMCVGGITPTGRYIALSYPAFIDSEYQHAYISDGVLENKKIVTTEEANDLYNYTQDDFYKYSWKDVSKSLIESDNKDSILFGCKDDVTDQRMIEMKRINVKLLALNRITEILEYEIPYDEIEIKENETAKDAITRLKTKYKNKIKKEDERYLEYALETMIRPLPSGYLPTFKKGLNERIVTRS